MDIDRKLLRDLITRIDETGDFPASGMDAVMLVEAARAYLEIPDPQLIQLLNSLGETRAILQRNAQQNAGSKDGQILEMMFKTVEAATTVIQQAMLRAQQ